MKPSFFLLPFLLGILLASSVSAQLFVSPRLFVNVPVNAFDDRYHAGLGGTVSLGVKKDQLTYSLNGGFTLHNAVNVLFNNTNQFDFGQLTLSVDYQTSDSDFSPFVGMEVGGAFSRIRTSFGQEPVQSANKSLLLIAPYAGLRAKLGDRLSFDIFAKMNLFLNARNSAAGRETAFVSFPLGVGLNYSLGE